MRIAVNATMHTPRAMIDNLSRFCTPFHMADSVSDVCKFAATGKP